MTPAAAPRPLLLRPLDALDGYFFPLTTAARLAVMRIILVALQLAFFMDPLSSHMRALRAPEFIHPRVLITWLTAVVPEATVRSAAFLTALWYGTVVLGVLALVGLFARTATLLFGLGNLLLISHLYSYGECHHPEAIYLLTITFLGLGPCGQCLSLDAWLRRGRGDVNWGLDATTRMAMWPLLLGQWLLVIAYFEAFAAKASVGGVQWMNGYTLQNYMLQDGVKSDMPLGIYLAQFRWLCVFLSAGALALEAGFFVIMFQRWAIVRRLTPWVLLSGAMMHTMIYLTQAAPFFEFVALYLMWVPWERVIGRVRSSSRMPVQLPAAAATVQS